MSAPILNALTSGFTSKQIIDYLIRKFPQHANKIHDAVAMGFGPKQILSFLTGGRKELNMEESRTQTEHERTVATEQKEKRNINRAAIGLAGVAGTALGGYALSRALPSIVQQIAPNLLQSGIAPTTIQAAPQQPIQQAAPQQPIQQVAPQQPIQQAAPQQPIQQVAPQQPIQQVAPQQPIQAAPQQPIQQAALQQPIQAAPQQPIQATTESLKQIPEIQDVLKKNETINNLWQAALQGKEKVENAPPGFMKTVKSLFKSGDIKDFDTFQNFYKWWQANPEKKRGNPLEEFELFRTQTKGMFEPIQPPKTVEKPKIVEKPKTVEKPKEDISVIGRMVKGTMENFYEGVFKSIQEGKETFSGIKEPLIKKAKPFFEKGLIKSPEDLKKFANQGEKAFETETVGNLALLPKGDIGEVESVKNGIAKLNVGGKEKHRKLEDLVEAPKDSAIQALELIKSFTPEQERSAHHAVNMYDETTKQAYFLFHNGEAYVVEDISPDEYDRLSTEVDAARTTGETSIGAWATGKGSRGAAYQNIVKNLKKPYRKLKVGYNIFKELQRRVKEYEKNKNK